VGGWYDNQRYLIAGAGVLGYEAACRGLVEGLSRAWQRLGEGFGESLARAWWGLDDGLAMTMTMMVTMKMAIPYNLFQSGLVGEIRTQLSAIFEGNAIRAPRDRACTMGVLPGEKQK